VFDAAATTTQSARRWGIGGEPGSEQGLVVGDEGVALRLREATSLLAACPVGGRFHLAQQPLQVFGPRLCCFRPSSPSFLQRSWVPAR
jgi:hypothetical protein